MIISTQVRGLTESSGQTNARTRLITMSQEEAALYYLIENCWVSRGLPAHESENRALRALQRLRENDPRGGTWCLLSVR
jgi:hypothetical protein